MGVARRGGPLTGRRHPRRDPCQTGWPETHLSSCGGGSASPAPRSSMTASDAAATILVVEDDAATRTYLADNLTADGYELLVAGTAPDALALMETRFPDLAIVDLGLPGPSGLDLLAAVRRADGVASRIGPGLPILVLSGRAGELDRLRGFDRGCDDYVTKPFGYPELRARVRARLRRADRRGRSGRPRGRHARAQRAPARPAGARVPEGVRAAAGAGERADPRVHEGGAIAHDLGLPRARDHAHARLARVPTAQQARNPRRSLHRQRVGRRLPARRRP